MSGIDISTPKTILNTGVLQLQNGVAMSSTLNSVTDQSNTASSLQLSTTTANFTGYVGIGTTTPSQPLEVSSNNANNILLIRSKIGAGTGSSVSTLRFLQADSYESTISQGVGSLIINTHGSSSPVQINGTLAVGSISGAKVGIKGTGSTSATTSLLVQNSGGTDMFRVRDDGLTLSYNGILTTGGDSTLNTTTGVVRLQKNGSDYIYINNDSFALRLLGTQVTMNPTLGVAIGALYDLSSNYAGYRGVNIRGNWTLNLSNTPDASAALQADSTTRGFLPPRMTDAQIRAIAAPAEGLVAYNTTISHLCCYQAGVWVKLSHTPM